jgi:hypothetical protein
MISSQNLSKEDDACADLIIYADDATALSNFNDLGINNSRFDGRIHRIIVNSTAGSWSLGETVFQRNGAGANIAVGQIRDITTINATAVSLKIRVSEDDGIPTYVGMADFANTTGSNLALRAVTSGSNASVLHAVPFGSPAANTLSRRNYAFTAGRRGDGYLYNANSALTIGTTGGGIRSQSLSVSTAFSSGANVLTLSSGNTSSIKPDMNVTGTGIDTGTYITSVVNSTAFRLSRNTTGTGSGAVTLRDEFYDLSEANNPIIFHVGGMMAKDEVARISGTGNFTIGPNTTSRSAKLTVNGTANLVGQVNVGANLNVTGSINATANVNAPRGVFTGNVVVGDALINTSTFTVGNATVNANFVEIDGNSTISTAILRSSNLTIGNNTVTDSGLIRVQNSASSANLTSNGLNAGISTVGQSTIAVGANVVVNASTVSVGNTLVNVVMSQNTTTALSVTGNASISANLTTANLIITSAVRGQANFAGNVAVTGNVNVTGNVYAPHGVFTTTVNVGQVLLTTTEIDVGSNVSANFTSFSVAGNSTVSTSVLQSGNLNIGNSSVTDSALVRVQNSTSTANMTPGLFSAGISSVNTTAVAVGANVVVNASTVSVGNSTVNVVVSQNTTAALQVTGNATVSANLTTANLIVTSAIRGQANFAGNVAVTGNNVVTGNVYAPHGVFTTSVNVGSVSLSTTQASVGGNVALDLTGLKISGNTLIPSMNISGGNITSGNSTIANTPTVRVVNATASANLTPTGLESGSIVVNAAGQTINVGANVWINSTVLAMGNATANVVIEPGAAQWVLSVKGDARVNGSLLVKGDAIVNGSLTFSNTVAVNGDFIPVLNDSFDLGNTDRQWGAAYVVEINVPDGGRTTVGNSTVNSVVFHHSVRVSNSSNRFANVGLDAISIGNTTSNGQLSQGDLRIGVSTANAVLNASALVIGNSSVNSTVNSSSFTGNVTATTVNTTSLFATGTANVLTVNATTVNATNLWVTTANAQLVNSTTVNSTSVNAATMNAQNFFAVTNVVVGSAGGNVFANSTAFVGNVVATRVNASANVNTNTVWSTNAYATFANIATVNSTTVNATTVNAATFQVGAAFVANTTDVVTANLTVQGNLVVTGTTTSLNTATLDVKDLNITVAKGVPTAASAEGAGLTVDTAGVTWTYAFASNGWLSNANVSIGNSTVNVAANSSTFIGNVVATRITGNLIGNVAATTISGNLTGNVIATNISGNLTGNVVATNISGNLTGNVAAITISGNLTGNVVATTISGNLTGNVSSTVMSASANVTVGANVLINSSALFIGNASVNSTVNSTFFTGTANNSNNFNGQPASFYTNATNITTGTLPYAQIPPNVINTTAAFTRTGITTFNANVVLGSSGLSANGGFGTLAQVLHSNGSATYWAADNEGVTQVIAGSGLSGGTITETGTIAVVAGNTQLISNSSGVWANQANFNHDALSNYDANKHVDHTAVTMTAGNGLTGGGTIAASRSFAVVAGNTQLISNSTGVWANQAAFDHDALANFVTNEHVDHSTVSMTAGNGLTGGGTIAASRSFAVVAGNTQLISNSTGVWANQAAFNHDALSGFVADEHVAHTGVSIIAGTGLSGGGTIAASRTLSVNPSAVDHDALLNFVTNEHVDHSTVSMTAGNGLTGGGTIAASRSFAVVAGNTQLISNATGIWANQAAFNHDALSGFVADEHVAHSTVSITAGNGLTGGGTIAASRTVSVLANTGLVANATGLHVNATYISSLSPSATTTTINTVGSGNYTIPSTGTIARIRLWGGGGSGGRGGGTGNRAGGGGGGGFLEMIMPLSELGAAGAQVAYSVGAGGAAVSAAGPGNPGEQTNFGNFTAYGGAAGNGNLSTPAGGKGGGFGGGTVGGGESGTDAYNDFAGGGGGGASSSGAFAGGGANWGGGGGGGGSNSGQTSADGGISDNGGNGGTGGAAASVTNGSIPGGGGGGNYQSSGSSGAGARGRIQITVW